jgi:hypothetical protein
MPVWLLVVAVLGTIVTAWILRRVMLYIQGEEAGEVKTEL